MTGINYAKIQGYQSGAIKTALIHLEGIAESDLNIADVVAIKALKDALEYEEKIRSEAQ